MGTAWEAEQRERRRLRTLERNKHLLLKVLFTKAAFVGFFSFFFLLFLDFRRAKEIYDFLGVDSDAIVYSSKENVKNGWAGKIPLGFTEK